MKVGINEDFMTEYNSKANIILYNKRHLYNTIHYQLLSNYALLSSPTVFFGGGFRIKK